MIYFNITNSFESAARTGIQRVVKELSSRLVGVTTYRFIVYSRMKFYLLSEEEVFYYICSRSFYPCSAMEISDFSRGDLFFDIDGSWEDSYDSESLYLALKKRGLILVKMHYDAVPVLFPNYVHGNTALRYIDNFSASLMYVDYWVCISRVVERDLISLASQMGFGSPKTYVIDLGSDIRERREGAILSAQCKKLINHIFILAVGTVEPRKNYDLILDVFDEVISDRRLSDVHLIIVGKSGWNNEKVCERIRGHKLYNIRLHWLESANDNDLEALYARARVCLCLSHYEGYGLPAVEALSRGVPVICTENTAMEEVSKGCAICVSPDIFSVMEAVHGVFQQGKCGRVNDYKATSWSASADQLTGHIDEIRSSDGFLMAPCQAVFISVRAGAICKSIASIINNMPFISEIVILTSDEAYSEMLAAINEFPMTFRLLKESEIGIKELPGDHQERNTLLRRVLYKSCFIDSNFIAFDDDYLVVEPIDVDFFQDGGRHRAFYFYENGLKWLGAFPVPTSFDLGIWRTVSFLSASGYDVRLYNSHCPQIINKKLVNEIFERTADLKLDEWSSYFNIAKHLKPDLFIDEFYRVAGWPPDFSSWTPRKVPESIIFYNDYGFDDGFERDYSNKWLSDLEKNLNKYLRVSPEIPVLNVSRAEVCFSCSEIISPEDYFLCIPIVSEIDIIYLKYSFLDSAICMSKQIPNFMHIPFLDCSIVSGNYFEVEAEVVSSCGVHHVARLRVNIEGR